ncbi:MAG: 50S ribosomal protein L22 [Elusimicrobiota bacterium]|jgi:large subunit ribosomal protein L22|nr:50S ribosomal protein L22 [Elusimicrobiota bacterium]
MSENISKIKYLRTSWRKASQVIDLIRGKRVDKAIGILTFTNKYVVPEILKAVKSGVNNMKENPENVFIKEVYVGQGMMMKRLRPGPQGRAMMYKKKTCMVTLKLERI